MWQPEVLYLGHRYFNLYSVILGCCVGGFVGRFFFRYFVRVFRNTIFKTTHVETAIICTVKFTGREKRTDFFIWYNPDRKLSTSINPDSNIGIVMESMVARLGVVFFMDGSFCLLSV